MYESRFGREMERLLDLEMNGTMPPVLAFWGHEAQADRPGPWMLSQWWPSHFEVEGVAYANAEAFMMAEKARLFGDEAALAGILSAEHPAIAKRLGGEVEGFVESEWTEQRCDIVVRGNLAKFSQDPGRRRYLCSTESRVLVEASPRDRIWGVGLSASDPRVARPSEWRGSNLLGFALQEVRSILLSERAPGW